MGTPSLRGNELKLITFKKASFFLHKEFKRNVVAEGMAFRFEKRRIIFSTPRDWE
jgi:hypothetical protein